MNFKVGDKVKLKDNIILNEMTSRYYNHGKIYVIKEMRYSGNISCNWDNRENAYEYSDLFELVKKREKFHR